jgi:hypothetical protein
MSERLKSEIALSVFGNEVASAQVQMPVAAVAPVNGASVE